MGASPLSLFLSSPVHLSLSLSLPPILPPSPPLPPLLSPPLLSPKRKGMRMAMAMTRRVRHWPCSLGCLASCLHPGRPPPPPLTHHPSPRFCRPLGAALPRSARACRRDRPLTPNRRARRPGPRRGGAASRGSGRPTPATTSRCAARRGAGPCGAGGARCAARAPVSASCAARGLLRCRGKRLRSCFVESSCAARGRRPLERIEAWHAA